MAISAKMAYLAKMAEMAINRQTHQTVIKKFKHDGQGALWKAAILAKMAYLAKMAEMAINRRNHQIINKNANEMAKGPFGK